MAQTNRHCFHASRHSPDSGWVRARRPARRGRSASGDVHVCVCASASGDVHRLPAAACRVTRASRCYSVYMFARVCAPAWQCVRVCVGGWEGVYLAAGRLDGTTDRLELPEPRWNAILFLRSDIQKKLVSLSLHFFFSLMSTTTELITD